MIMKQRAAASVSLSTLSIACSSESPLGNLFVDAIRDAFPGADAAVNNNGRGGLRADLSPGPLTYGALYDVFPFDNRLVELITRRKDEILRGILEEGWFDPIVPMIEDEDGKVLEGKDAMEGLGYWAAGFEWALANFPQLEEAALPGVPDLLDSIWRHLPEQDEAIRFLDREIDPPCRGHAMFAGLVLQRDSPHVEQRRRGIRCQPCPRQRSVSGASVLS